MGTLWLRTAWGIALLLGMFASTGCVQTAMLPASQLDAGETAVSVSIDEPGMLYVPRANGQFTYGLGGGDLSLNLGGTVGSFGGGVAARSYLSEAVNAEAQVQLADVWDARQWLVQAGIQGVPPEENSLFVGGQLGALRGTAPLEEQLGGYQRETPIQTVPFIGASLGYGRIELGKGWALQIELEANVPIPPTVEEDDRPLPPSKLSVGIFRHSN